MSPTTPTQVHSADRGHPVIAKYTPHNTFLWSVNIKSFLPLKFDGNQSMHANDIHIQIALVMQCFCLN